MIYIYINNTFIMYCRMFMYINHPVLRIKLLNAAYDEHNRCSLLYFSKFQIWCVKSLRMA
jgi:hypothetical protein